MGKYSMLLILYIGTNNALPPPWSKTFWKNLISVVPIICAFYEPIRPCNQKYVPGEHIASGKYHSVYEVEGHPSIVMRLQKQGTYSQTELESEFKKEVIKNEKMSVVDNIVTANCYILNQQYDDKSSFMSWLTSWFMQKLHKERAMIIPKVHAPSKINLTGTIYEKQMHSFKKSDIIKQMESTWSDAFINHVDEVYTSLMDAIIETYDVWSADVYVAWSGTHGRETEMNVMLLHNVAVSPQGKPLFIDVDFFRECNWLNSHADYPNNSKQLWDRHTQLLDHPLWRDFVYIVLQAGTSDNYWGK